jgi:DNA-binding MarR family transcriptional regulator
MGRIWAILYLNQDPMTMDDLVVAAGITKGHASTNLRALLRLGLVTKSWRPLRYPRTIDIRRKWWLVTYTRNSDSPGCLG